MTEPLGKMRILLVCTVPTGKSGIPNVIFNLIENMDKDGMEIGYVSINRPDDQYAKRLSRIGVKLYTIPRKMTNPIKYILNLAKVAKNYDVMHVHGNSATMLLEMIAAGLGGVKTRASHAHSTSCAMKLCDKICRPIFYLLCNCRFACSEAAGKWLFGNRNFIVIRNGIDTQKFKFNISYRNQIRSGLDIGDGLLVGHIGNFVDAKNHAFIIDVFSEIIKINEGAKLLLLGDGELLEGIKSKVRDLDLTDRVIFAGSVVDPEVYMSAMDVIVMPSIYEGMPLTLVEEQANGLDCIVSDVITREADLTGNIHYLSLDESPRLWASEIINVGCGSIDNRADKSNNAISEICRKNYDIFNISNDLKKYYTSRLNLIERKDV